MSNTQCRLRPALTEPTRSRPRRNERLEQVVKWKANVDRVQARLDEEIEKALDAGVRQEDVARAAGISRVTLWRHMKRASAAPTASPVTDHQEAPDGQHAAA